MSGESEERERVYVEPGNPTAREVMEAIRNDDVDRLIVIPIELGLHHEDWRFIQDISVRLSSHPDPQVRANSFTGIEYAARFRKKVEKNVVKPVLLRGTKDPVTAVSNSAWDAIETVNRVMGWKIGGAPRQRMLEKRFEARLGRRDTGQADSGNGD